VTNEHQKLKPEELEQLFADASDQIDEFDPFEELNKVTAERDSYLDQLQRSVAEFANFRRRTDQERANMRETAARGLLEQIVPVLDDFERAIASMPEDENSSWVQGIANIQRKLGSVLERAGVEQVESLWQPFDPAVHEAVASDPGTAGTHVIEVYQNGYRLGGQLLRPAMVKVGDPPAA
jgi:molecular chaperone GrpE